MSHWGSTSSSRLLKALFKKGWQLKRQTGSHRVLSKEGTIRMTIPSPRPSSRPSKYRPEFPDRFGSYEHARSVCRELFHWYNHEHNHGSIGLMTPAIVHPIMLHACSITDARF